jgi:hypothetical protein
MGNLMSQKEVKRAQVLDMLEEDKISQQEASVRLGICTRQIRRLSKLYREEGLAGLVSKKRGAVSNRRLGETLRSTAIGLIGTRYRDFGPTLANEKLAELHGIHLSVESARQMMISEGYWKAKKSGTVCAHPMRERRARFGELIQIDGSPHDWFEGRGERCTLLVFIDDATGWLTGVRFTATETTLGYMQVLHDHILAHGTPAALYSDKHSIFRINAKDADPDAETQFFRATRELGIECIAANTPQAKGRVERANQTLQDRMVKEMRLAGINDMDTANAWLPGYIEDYNRRFSVDAKDPSDAHQTYLGTPAELARTLSVQAMRTLSKNLSCQYKNQLLQIETTGTGRGLRGAKITVHEHFDGQKELIWRKCKLAYCMMVKPRRQGDVADSKTINWRVDKAMDRRSTEHKPAPNHPCRNVSVEKSADDGQCVTL